MMFRKPLRVALLAAAAVMSWALPAVAADIAKAPLAKAAAPAVANWTGFYIGGHAGGAWVSGDAQWDPLPSANAFGAPGIVSSLKTGGFLGGVHAGFNWQFAPQWVAGLEGDISWTRREASITSPWTGLNNNIPTPTSATSLSRTSHWLASARARIGYLVTPQALLYATGGVAWGRFGYAATARRTDLGYFAQTEFAATSTGFVVGGGLDYALSQHWTLRGEYLFYRFGSQSATASAAPAFTNFPTSFTWDKTNLNVARAALSYKF